MVVRCFGERRGTIKWCPSALAGGVGPFNGVREGRWSAEVTVFPSVAAQRSAEAWGKWGSGARSKVLRTIKWSPGASGSVWDHSMGGSGSGNRVRLNEFARWSTPRDGKEAQKAGERSFRNLSDGMVGMGYRQRCKAPAVNPRRVWLSTGEAAGGFAAIRSSR